MDDSIVSDINWKVSERYVDGWENPAFDDSSWSRASDFGRYGASPWNQVAGMPEDTSAHWIWSGKSNVNTPITEAYFRISFHVSEDGAALTNPFQSSGQFEHVEYQLKPHLPMPSAISRKLPVVNTVLRMSKRAACCSLHKRLPNNIKLVPRTNPAGREHFSCNPNYQRHQQ